MTEIAQLIKAWKDSKSNLPFSEWKSRQLLPNNENKITLDKENITQQQDIYPTKQRIRWAIGERGKQVRVKNWDEHKVKKALYLSKSNYEKLLKTKSVSGQIDKILSDFFRERESKLSNNKTNEEENSTS